MAMSRTCAPERGWSRTYSADRSTQSIAGMVGRHPPAPVHSRTRSPKTIAHRISVFLVRRTAPTPAGSPVLSFSWPRRAEGRKDGSARSTGKRQRQGAAQHLRWERVVHLRRHPIHHQWHPLLCHPAPHAGGGIAFPPISTPRPRRVEFEGGRTDRPIHHPSLRCWRMTTRVRTRSKYTCNPLRTKDVDVLAMEAFSWSTVGLVPRL
ncbi:hypothetical protein B0H14DRAFT_229857 [Mycena olivaceomarginata]|nr:hypothetical protein B0H14DRAFT_229857 [Mycena olivaceomarginata]